MCLNKELLERVRLVEGNYDSFEDWPAKTVRELNDLANRDYFHDEDFIRGAAQQAKWMFKRGFTDYAISKDIGLSRSWVAKRRPQKIKYRLTKPDREKLRMYVERGTSTAEISRRMLRLPTYITEMRKQFERD